MLASYIKENQTWPKQIEQALGSIRKINLFSDFIRDGDRLEWPVKNDLRGINHPNDARIKEIKYLQESDALIKTNQIDGCIAGIIAKNHMLESKPMTPTWTNPETDLGGVLKQFDMGFLYQSDP